MLKATAELFLRHSSYRAVPIRYLTSAAAEEQQEERLQTFKTHEADPSKHNTEHLAQFYTIPASDKNVLFKYGGLTLTFQEHIKTFNETCFMVREPAIDIINCLKSIDFNKPAVRFVLYGRSGLGKSISLAHVIHYAFRNNFLVVHVPWVGDFMRHCKDRSNSETKEGFIDLNIDAAAWLLHFRTQNAEMLQNPALKISRDIQWTKRESTPKDSSLLDLVEHGINRIRFASNCINILAEEIKLLSNAGICKTLVAIDGFNEFFYPKTKVYTERKEVVHPSKITLTEGFLNLTKFDWKNAAVVVTVDKIAVIIHEKGNENISYLPRYLLGKHGFEHLDPFVPVEVRAFSRKEHKSIMDYFRERKWIQSYPGQDDELYFLTGGNPFTLLNYCKAL